LHLRRANIFYLARFSPLPGVLGFQVAAVP